MARLGVTYQDIANSAEFILGQGRQPTIELIRNHLGTGSTTTIANHLRKWRAEQDGATSVAIKENLPQEFISMMKGLWQRLQAHADNQIVLVKQESEQHIRQLHLEVEKYKTNNQRWQQLFNQWQQEKEKLNSEKMALEQAVIALQQEKSALFAKFEAQEQQMQDKQERILELNRLHKLAQENLEHYRESARVQRLIDQEKYAEQIQQIQMQLKNTEQQFIKANQDMVILQRQLDKVIHENLILQKTNESISSQANKLQSDFVTLQKELSETKRDAIHWQKQCDITEKRFTEQSSILAEQQKQHALIEKQFVMARDEVKELKEQNKFLAREKWEIEQGKAQLEGANNQLQKMIQSKEVC